MAQPPSIPGQQPPASIDYSGNDSNSNIHLYSQGGAANSPYPPHAFGAQQPPYLGHYPYPAGNAGFEQPAPFHPGDLGVPPPQQPQQQQPQQPQQQPYYSQYPLPPYASPQVNYPQQVVSPQQQQQQQQHLPSTITDNNAFPSPAPDIPPIPSPATLPPSRKITLRVNGGGRGDDMVASRARRQSTANSAHAESTGRSSRRVSGVNYREDDDDDDDFEDDDEPEVLPRSRTRGRAVVEEPEDEVYHDEVVGGEDDDLHDAGTRHSTRARKAPRRYHGEDDFEDSMIADSSPPKVASTRAGRAARRRVIVDPDEAEEDHAEPYTNGEAVAEPVEEPRPVRTTGRLRGRKNGHAPHNSDDDALSFEPSESGKSTASETEAEQPIEDDETFDESTPPPRRAVTRRTVGRRAGTRSSKRLATADSEEEGATRNLRKRDSRPNYQLPPLDISAEIAQAEELNKAIAGASGPRGGRRRNLGLGMQFGGLGGDSRLPWQMKGKDLAQAMGDPDSSDSDADLPPIPNAAAGPSAVGRTGPGGPGGAGPSDVPNFGRVNPKSNMADADPLGVDVNVTFDRVGGLDDHINQLKEMVALPLLYPELFQQFGIIPPRGVLFHGPPGTGKTLLARALAASASNGNTKISFFMRKGADVLSKWVGEAERQLRMLFEEARASQPSIIFFDEIDGLAPVRSSKQDQIHASLVSTLLALMDGMDGRGQVIVIGATNRPDAVDPALRRPGRFDREFYFPLPNLDARRQIISINTRAWEPQLPGDMLDTLARLTKGYGGADLRALCTEAALNAIQRKYPQIYKTADRLLVEPGSIRVQPKDFMLAVKKIVPSSARSTTSAAIQLPKQLEPLLSGDLDRLKAAVDLAMPRGKKRTALEEAEFVDDDGDSFEKEMMLQSLDKLRTYRPRLLVYGAAGSGQGYLGPAILHHLEGFHVQSMDLATLMSDSTRTPEAGIVQMFVEAKRHQPSIIFIPSLAQWSETMTEQARSTTRALLDGISPSDPVLLLAIVDGPLATLPPDVRAWFGFSDENRIELGRPSADQREQFFSELLESVERPPTAFPDGVPRKRRVLEILPPAPPLPPRKPTEAELARDIERDNAARNMLLVSFSSLVAEFMRKYRRPVALIKEDAFAYATFLAEQAAREREAAEVPVAVEVEAVPAEVAVEGPAIVTEVVAPLDPPLDPPEDPALDPAQPVELIATNEGTVMAEAVEPLPVDIPVTGVTTPAVENPSTTWAAHNIDFDIIQRKLVRHKYWTPNDFLADIALIEENAKHSLDPDRQIKISEMAAHARMHVHSFDPKWTPEFERYAQRMRERKAERARVKAAAAEAAEKEKAEAAEKERAEEATNAATEPAPEGEPAPTEADSSKRPREDDTEGNDERAKRAREDGMDVDEPIESVPDPTQTVESIDTQSAGVDSVPAQETAQETTQATQETAPPPPSPSPPPVYPPLVVPSEAINTLGKMLKHATGKLTVDELEQLRASLLDRVWRARTDWDRTALVTDMRDAVDRYVRQVEEVRPEE